LHNSSADRARENNALALWKVEQEEEGAAGSVAGKQETREENKKGRKNGKEPRRAGGGAGARRHVRVARDRVGIKIA